MNSQKLVILHLSLINKIGPSIIKFLLDNQPSNFDWQNIYLLSKTELQNNFKLNINVAEKIFEALKDKDILDKELELIFQNNIKWLTFLDEKYPDLLKNIHLPPPVLYCQGKELNDSDKKIAIVGSRKADKYGLKIIDYFIKPLIENKWTIVSGGASGADTMAHESALAYQGKTIAVMGSGLLRPYPYCNKKLFQKIVDNEGTLLSPYPLLCEPLPGNFPARNRIISGISKGCLVIQAALKSGTRITALHALEQGREVFAVPGLIFDDLTIGCHKLIQEGAKLVYCPEDILEEFGETKAEIVEIVEHVKQLNIENNLQIENNATIDQKIINACRMPISIDDLSKKLDLNTDDLQLKLFNLQLEGQIRQNFAGLWEQENSI